MEYSAVISIQPLVYNFDNGTIGMFILGAPVYINETIDTQMALCNGTYGTMDSLFFYKEEKNLQNIEKCIQLIRNGKAGERIHIDIVPTYINVKIEK